MELRTFNKNVRKISSLLALVGMTFISCHVKSNFPTTGIEKQFTKFADGQIYNLTQGEKGTVLMYNLPLVSIELYDTNQDGKLDYKVVSQMARHLGHKRIYLASFEDQQRFDRANLLFSLDQRTKGRSN